MPRPSSFRLKLTGGKCATDLLVGPSLLEEVCNPPGLFGGVGWPPHPHAPDSLPHGLRGWKEPSLDPAGDGRDVNTRGLGDRLGVDRARFRSAHRVASVPRVLQVAQVCVLLPPQDHFASAAQTQRLHREHGDQDADQHRHRHPLQPQAHHRQEEDQVARSRRDVPRPNRSGGRNHPRSPDPSAPQLQAPEVAAPVRWGRPRPLRLHGRSQTRCRGQRRHLDPRTPSRRGRPPREDPDPTSSS